MSESLSSLLSHATSMRNNITQIAKVSTKLVVEHYENTVTNFETEIKGSTTIFETYVNYVEEEV